MALHISGSYAGVMDQLALTPAAWSAIATWVGVVITGLAVAVAFFAYTSGRAARREQQTTALNQLKTTLSGPSPLRWTQGFESRPIRRE